MTSNELEILCIGNALVDVFAQGDEHVDIRYGITQPVQHVEIDKLREILSVLPKFTVVSGGGAANVAKIAGLLGTKTGFTGALGRGKTEGRSSQADEFGRLFEENLSAAGVKLRLPLKPSPTGICLILQTEEGETRIAASPSAALELSEDDINEDDLRNAKAVVIDGFMLDRPGLVRHILDLADQYGTTAAIDLSSPIIAEERVVEILDYARQHSLILFMNDTEAESFYKGLKNHGMEVRDMGLVIDEDEQGSSSFSVERRKPGSPFRRICSFFKILTDGNIFPIIVIKQGPRGAIVFAGGNIHRAETLAVIPLETTGAGDAFSAAFLTAWVRNKSLSECAAVANKAARIILDVAGTKVDRKPLQSIARQLRQTPVNEA